MTNMNNLDDIPVDFDLEPVLDELFSSQEDDVDMVLAEEEDSSPTNYDDKKKGAFTSLLDPW